MLHDLLIHFNPHHYRYVAATGCMLYLATASAENWYNDSEPLLTILLHKLKS